MSAAAPMLEVRNAMKSFGGLRVIAGANFDVARGSLTALIGPNGAGKTTMLDLLSGFARLDSGTIRLANRSIAGMAPHRIARLGLVRSFQLTRVLAGMSVLDNMLLAVPHQPGEHLLSLVARPRNASRKEARARIVAEELLEGFGLASKAADYAGSLSSGQRKLLEIARALMTEPSILLLDEPMAGVNLSLGLSILDRIAILRQERGLTLLFVEHNMEVVMSYADRVVVMAQGRVIAAGTPVEIRANPAVIEAYLGTPTGTIAP